MAAAQAGSAAEDQADHAAVVDVLVPAETDLDAAVAEIAEALVQVEAVTTEDDEAAFFQCLAGEEEAVVTAEDAV